MNVHVWCPYCAELHEATYMVDDQGSYYRTECGIMIITKEDTHHG